MSDADLRAGLESDFTGARGLFRAVDAQGARVRIVFVAVDPAARGRSTLAPAVAVVAVQPRIPAVGLGLGLDFVLSALEGALAIETPLGREPVEVDVGRAVRFGFGHRVVDRGGPGRRAELDGALVTTDASSFLVLRNVDAESDGAAPRLDEILDTLRVLP